MTRLPFIILLVFLSASHAVAQKVLLDTIHFDHNRASLKYQSLNTLDEVVAQAQGDDVKTFRIHITAHTDSTGDLNYNNRLSLKRAKTSVDYLVAKGIDSNLISIRPFGETIPIRSNKTENGRQGNRRVEIRTVIFERPQLVEENETDGAREEQAEIEGFVMGDLGTQIFFDSNSFYPYCLDEIEVQVTEAFSPGALIQNNWPTHTSDGQMLASAGSINIQALYEGEAIEMSNGMMQVRIPADEFDPDMQLWVSNGDVAENGWDATDIELVEDENGGSYYTFSVSSTGYLNLDKIVQPDIGLDPKKLISAIIPDRWEEKRRHTIKSKDIDIATAYIVTNSGQTVLLGEALDAYNVQFDSGAFSHGAKLVAFTERGRNAYNGYARGYYLVCTDLDKLHYQPVWQRYVLERQDFRAVSNRTRDRILAKL